ncbi:MAG: response regulator transcription factor [Candidatus Acidiferrales bacterium]
MQIHQRILVVDDHPCFRQLLRTFLEHNPNWEACGEASDGCEAITKTTELHPDIVLMDLDMPRLNGLEATRQIHKQSPSIRILILTLHDNSMLPQIAQNSGAQGYVLKSESLDVLTRAIETVGESDQFFVSSKQ